MASQFARILPPRCTFSLPLFAARPDENKITVFPWICCAWIATVGFIAITFRYFLFTWLFLFVLVVPPLILAALPIAAIATGVWLLIKQEYWRALRWLLVPVAGACIATLGYQTGDYVIFLVHRPIYEAIVRDVTAGRCSEHNRSSWPVRVDLVNCGSPVIVVFLWNGFLATWYGVIYDAADQISKPPEQRSQEWQASGAGKILKYSIASRALGGHYYLASGDYSSE